MRCFFRPIAGNDRIVDPTLFTGILSRDLAGRINWGKTARLASHDAFFISLYTQLLSLTPTDPYPYLDYL
jgi:hypothetical protein